MYIYSFELYISYPLFISLGTNVKKRFYPLLCGLIVRLLVEVIKLEKL